MEVARSHAAIAHICTSTAPYTPARYFWGPVRASRLGPMKLSLPPLTWYPPPNASKSASLARARQHSSAALQYSAVQCSAAGGSMLSDSRGADCRRTRQLQCSWRVASGKLEIVESFEDKLTVAQDLISAHQDSVISCI